jgi:hypothetical protein
MTIPWTPITLKQSPISTTARIYNLLRRRHRARRLGMNSGVEQIGFLSRRRCLLTVCVGPSAPRTTTSCANGAGYCRSRWIFSVHARNTYPDAIIHTYEPNPSMKQFLKHQSGTGGFTYFLEPVGKKDDMVSTRALAPGGLDNQRQAGRAYLAT